MLGLKLLENWWVWMMADVIYIGLYWYKALYLTAVLDVLFLGMCIAGLAGWKKSLAGKKAGKDAGREAEGPRR
jgi:nicotinamide mononucleotide transporter